MNSFEYYNKNANKFQNSVKDAKMNNQVKLFTKYLKPHSHILDAGCGTGRDSFTFLNMGFKVTSFDASIEMCKIASELIHQEVKNMKFEEMSDDNVYDGIWASASLLHVERTDMLDVYKKLADALKEKGYLYCSYKLRDVDFSKDGRSFTCYTPESFRDFVKVTPFKIVELIVGGDSRPGRDEEMWLNAILQKK